MDFGFRTCVAGYVFIKPDTGVIASENLFSSIIIRMTGLKDVRRNVNDG
ncbi:hypothetical protein HmCmsJML044_01222 [Escherichia coli]|nr:hypothetical protein HmCmsJML044_01222 [Escherichia coli]